MGTLAPAPIIAALLLRKCFWGSPLRTATLPKRYGNGISAAAALQNRARCEAEAAPLLSSTAQRESQRPQRRPNPRP